MSSIESDIYDIIAEKSAVDRTRLSREARLEELEIESLDVVEIVFALEEKFDIHIPYNANDQGKEFETVGDVVDAVQNLMKEQGASA